MKPISKVGQREWISDTTLIVAVVIHVDEAGFWMLDDKAGVLPIVRARDFARELR